jgi:hypothetical protein
MQPQLYPGGYLFTHPRGTTPSRKLHRNALRAFIASTLNEVASKNENKEMRTMRKLHKGLIIGGATLAALVPAGLVVADQADVGTER